MRRAILAAVLCLCACKTGPLEDVPTGTGGGTGSGGRGARVVPNVVAGSSGRSTRSLAGRQRDGLLASTSGTSLFSLKYAIAVIQLCEDLQRNGSGFSNSTGCVRLYQLDLPEDPDFYRNYTVSSALADTTPGRYVDLMTEAGRAVLRSAPNADPVPAGTYRYGLVNFLRPIRVTAEFPVVGGQPGDVVRTRATSSVEPLNGMGFPLERAIVGDTRSADPAEETTYMLNNGGAFFAFAEPFVVTDADADAGTPITMDLVFNPANFGQVMDAPGGDCAADSYSPICDPTNQLVFQMPFVRMSPVPRKAGEQTRKEVYLVDYDSGASASQLRVELYYNAADAQKAVRGVDVALVYLPTATLPTVSAVDGSQLVQSGSVSDGTASVTLQDYTGAPALSGLLRGQSGTATLRCNYTAGSVCPAIGAEVQRAYTFVEDVLVSED